MVQWLERRNINHTSVLPHHTHALTHLSISTDAAHSRVASTNNIPSSIYNIEFNVTDPTHTQHTPVAPSPEQKCNIIFNWLVMVNIEFLEISIPLTENGMNYFYIRTTQKLETWIKFKLENVVTHIMVIGSYFVGDKNATRSWMDEFWVLDASCCSCKYVLE